MPIIARSALTVLTLAILTSPVRADEPAVVATVGDTPITKTQLENHVRPQLIAIDAERYEALKGGLDQLIANELFKKEAAAKNVSPEVLQQQEIIGKVTAPTDAEIQSIYDQNKAQLQGQTLEQVKPRIVEYLTQQKMAARSEQYIEELKKKYKTTVALKPPLVEVATKGRPARGGANAPITIVMFSDYECPYCKRGEASVAEVMKAYGDKVKVVFRHYPLEFHANAKPAAEAAMCANEQGKFWEFHDKLFATVPLNADAFKKIAGEIGLDQAKFDQCVSSHKFASVVEEDMADGARAGVNGTPAFFINGRVLSGAQPFDKFKEVIDEELATKS